MSKKENPMWCFPGERPFFFYVQKKSLGSCIPGDKAYIDFRLTEFYFGTGDAEIAGRGKLTSTT
jgi:hypothetical protein